MKVCAPDFGFLDIVIIAVLDYLQASETAAPTSILKRPAEWRKSEADSFPARTVDSNLFSDSRLQSEQRMPVARQNTPCPAYALQAKQTNNNRKKHFDTFHRRPSSVQTCQHCTVSSVVSHQGPGLRIINKFIRLAIRGKKTCLCTLSPFQLLKKICNCFSGIRLPTHTNVSRNILLTTRKANDKSRLRMTNSPLGQ